MILLEYIKKISSWLFGWVPSFFIPLTLVMLILSTVVVIIFTVLQVDYIVDAKYSSLKVYGDEILGLFGVNVSDSIDDQKYSSILSAFIGSFSVLVTIWFAFSGVFYAIKRSRIASIEVKPIRQDSHDLEIMLPYYKQARSVVVYAGSFDWVRKNTKLQAIVKALAKDGNIRMISDKSASKVKEGLGDELYKELESCIEYESNKKDIRCSLLSNGNHKVVLYKEAGAGLYDPQNKPNIVVIKNSDSTSYLLSVLEKLISKC